MDTITSKIKYNYYSIECVNLRKMSKNIISTYQGRINDPNIIYKNGNTSINYQATELRIYCNIHNIDDEDGEIVILHRPTTLGIKMYCCFPIVYKENCKVTEIDSIILSKTFPEEMGYYQGLSLELNKYIKDSPSMRIYESIDSIGDNCLVVVFENLISINQKLKLGKDTFLGGKKGGIPKMNLTETEDKLRTSSYVFKDMHKKEGFEGQGEEVIYSCEYLPVDSEDMVQVLQVPIGSPGYSTLVSSQVTNLFLNNGIFMLIVIIWFCVSPFLYNIFVNKITSESIFLKNIDWIDNIMGKGTKINLFNLMLVLIICTSAIILIIIGIAYENSTCASIGMFLPFLGFISYLAISFFGIRKNLRERERESDLNMDKN